MQRRSKQFTARRPLARGGRRPTRQLARTKTAARRSVSARAKTGSTLRSATRSTTARARSASATRSRKTAPAKRGGRASTRRRQSGKTTTDHDFIRNWVEQRGGTPSTVGRTSSKRSPAGILRIDFPGYSGRGSLKPISWDEWFDQFEERGLAFLYQDKTADGKRSNFCKMISR